MLPSRDAGADAQDVPISGGLVLALIISCVTSVALGLVLAWVSIERTALGYSTHKLQGDFDSRNTHVTQLEIERDRLISPYILERKAKELGMKKGLAGQIRRMGNGTLESLPR